MIAIIVVGVASGLLGMLITLFLHAVQHLAYGYSLYHIISPEHFLEGARAASPERRMFVLMLCGLIAGLGWWLLSRYGSPLVSIAEAVTRNKVMPRWETLIHIILQAITVALGSPMGREVAPRELCVLFTQYFLSKIHLPLKDRQILLACAAGAGLAAIYNVPFAGAIFTMEVLLGTFSWPVLIPALATAAIAVLVSWIGLENKPLYQVFPHLTISTSLIVWSILIGPILGYVAYQFHTATENAHQKITYHWSMPILSFLNYSLIGCLAIYFPAILGNGRSPAQIEFSDLAGVQLSLILLILRLCILWSTIRSGTRGGLLTPSLANGALLAAVLGGLWRLQWPGTPLAAFAIIGATAFLAAAQKMPITAIVIIFEFTHVNLSFIIPVMFAVAGSVGMFNRCSHVPK